MTLAEHMYRMLLRLYPRKHRQAYEQPMLQHARDLSLAARQRGRWHVAWLCLRLLKDGIVNAAIEHMEAIRMANNRYKPVPWLSVVLASFPGLLVALSRRRPAPLGPPLAILWYLCLGLPVLALPLIRWQRRRFPVWALLPAGALMWRLTYTAGTELSRQVNALHIHDLAWMRSETGIALLNILLAAALFVALLRGQRVPGSIWLVIGVMVFGNVLLALLYSLALFGGARLFPAMLQYFTTPGVGPVEGLMLVAVGLLAARRQGVLALLVVVGGYSYMCLDNDYLFGYPFREWTGLSAYLAAVTVLFLVVVPVALLRAKTRLGRALAVFAPVVAFHIARLTIPLLVIQQPIKVRPGDVTATINIVLSFVLAWVLYNHIGKATYDAEPDGSLEASGECYVQP
jgi:hypothetical protein